MGNANAASDLERAEHLNYGDGKGVKRVSLYNNGVQINAATSDKQDEIIGNMAFQFAQVGNFLYLGQAVPGSATSSAIWQIQRVDTTSGVVITWANGSSSYTNIWDNYASLTYS